MAYKIVIVCGGDHKRGMGHVYRMKTLSNALLEALGCTVYFIIDSDTVAYPLTQETKNNIYCVPRNDYTIRHRIINNIKPKLVIVDIYDTTKEELEVYRHQQSKLMIFENNTAAATIADCVVNAIIDGTNNTIYRRNDTTYYIGPRYMILHPSFKKSRPISPVIRESVKTITVALGGADALNITEIVSQWLSELRNQEIIIVKGPAGRINSGPVLQRDNIIRVSSPDNLSVVLSKCDLAVTGGGLTAYEAACLGIPTIIIPQAIHEIDTARKLVDYGTAMMVNNTIERIEFTQVINELDKDKSRRCMMAYRGLQLLDGDINPILNVIKNLVI